MRITDLEVDGYGIWTGLRLRGLSDGLNVLYGPNEAGKTTLLQFVRSLLYGFSPARRKYLPPIRGGRPGGSMDLAGPHGRFHLDRHEENGGAGGGEEQLTLTAADGTRQGEHFVKVLLSGVDEAIYNNVFAVGLREIQELATLSDTEAAKLLYNLTAGLDRVSLGEVMQELETSRNRILHRQGAPCQVVALLDQREKLRREMEELGRLTRRYARLAAERNQLDREVTRLEEENQHAEYQARVVELAITLRGHWQRRAELDDQLAALGPARAMPEGAIDRFDALTARLQKHQHRAEQLRRQRETLRAEAAGLEVNEALWRQAARIEALREQEPWITTLQNRIAQGEEEVAGIEQDLAAEQEQLGLGNRVEPGSLPVVSTRARSALRPAARALKHCRQRVVETRQEVAANNEEARSLAGQIASALSARSGNDLAVSLDTAGNLVSQLRRRVQIDERLDQMTRYQEELEQQSRRLVERQLLPIWVLLALGAVFVLGVVLVMAGLFMPGSITGSVGWLMAVLGLGGAGLAGGGKVLLERSNARRLEACQKQIGMLQLQIQQAKEERDALDATLPRGGGPIPGRLEAAERELAALEELAPLDTRRRTTEQEAHAAAGRVHLAESELAKAAGRWREALAAAGLPHELAPKQVRQLMQRAERLGELHRRLEHRREELLQRRRELDSLTGRIAQLAADAGTAVDADDPIERLRQLGEALGRQEAATQRRDLLRQQARRLRRKRMKHEEVIGRLKHRRHELLREADAEDEQAFRQRAVQAARAETLQQERDAISREIATAIGGHCPQQAVHQQLEGHVGEGLEARRDELLDRLGALEKELQQRFEKRGRLSGQLKALAEDKQMGAKQLELATVEKRLQEAIDRWQVLAVTGRTLEAIRTAYEQERQPETLQEASRYLDRLTQGRYRRVWTPLSEDVLRVDDAEGNSLPLEVLSRGTREQLFLSLRLALAASYARRGAPLPLVLDDVLVNFDAARAKAAAAVLRDFAAGHQLLVFTCHEHIFKLFKSLGVPAGELPDSADAKPAPLTFQQPAKKRTRRSRKAAPPPPIVEKTEEEPADEITPVDDEPTLDVTDRNEAAELEVIESLDGHVAFVQDNDDAWEEAQQDDQYEDDGGDHEEPDYDDEDGDDDDEEDDYEDDEDDEDDDYEDEEDDDYDEDESAEAA